MILEGSPIDEEKVEWLEETTLVLIQSCHV